MRLNLFSYISSIILLIHEIHYETSVKSHDKDRLLKRLQNSGKTINISNIERLLLVTIYQPQIY